MTTGKLFDGQNLVGIVANNSPHYISALSELLKANRIAVPLRKRDDHERIAATTLGEIVETEKGAGWFTPDFKRNASDALAQISFTSGTEGAPKGVVLSHRALDDAVERLVQISGIDASAREYIGVPVYHSFGYGRCRVLSAVGAQGYIPSQGFNPLEIAQMLREGHINALSAVPSLLRILLDSLSAFGEERLSLRWIEIGSQPMSADEKSRLREAFPKANIVQHYGLTEASRTTLLRIDSTPSEHLDSVGKAEGATQVRINERGHICIKGPHLASGLLVDHQFGPLPQDGDWFETSDLGELRGDYLYFLGRADNVINCGGQKITAERVESELTSHFSLTGGICVTRIPDASYGEAILLCIENTVELDRDQLRQHALHVLAESGIQASRALQIAEVERLPTTDTGKIQRRQLTDWYIGNVNNHDTQNADTATGDPEDAIVAVFKKQLAPDQTLSLSESINSLKLDSIATVAITMKLDQVLGYIPQHYRDMSIAELTQLSPKASPSAASSENHSTVLGARNENPRDMSFWQLVQEDFVTHERDWFSQGFWAVFNHRFGNQRMDIKPKLLRAPMTVVYRIHRKLVQWFCGIKLDYTVKLGRRVKLEHFGGMIIGAKAIGDDVTIRQNTTLGVKDLSNLRGKPTIEQGVNIGTGAVIVGDIRVGRYSVIGPNSVVDRDLPPFSTVSAPRATVN